MDAVASYGRRFWLTLDNAAKIFPAIISDEVPAVVRLTAVLKEPVKIKPLLKAVLYCEQRFPYFIVQLKEGFFWYYLEHLPKHIPVLADTGALCRKFSRKELLIRVLVRNKKISIEFSHILSDGGGGFQFLRTLLVEYSKACGANPLVDHSIRASHLPIDEQEYEDAYKRYFKEEIPPMIRRSKAFHLPFALNRKPRYQQTTHLISLQQIKQVANAKGVSITVFLVAAYLFVLQEIFEALPLQRKRNKYRPLRVQVPVDLRNIFPSKTMRNFSLFVMPELDLRLGHYTFDEVLKTVFHQMALESDEKLINKNIARNVGSEKKIYVRGIPLFIKSAVLRMKSYSLGASQYSGVVTNMGAIQLPDETAELIDYFIAIPPPPNKALKLNCGVVGFGDHLVLSFGNITKSKEFENKYRQFLSSQGVIMKAEKNKQEL